MQLLLVKAQIPLSDEEDSHTLQNQVSGDQMLPRAVYTNPFDPKNPDKTN